MTPAKVAAFMFSKMAYELVVSIEINYESTVTSLAVYGAPLVV